MGTIYAVPMLVEHNKQGLDTHCFGDCGKISMFGAIEMDDLGPCWVCCEESCPYAKGDTEIVGKSEMTGDDVRIRILNKEG